MNRGRQRNPSQKTRNIFNKTIEENFPKLKKEVPVKLQEANTKQTRTITKKASYGT